VNTPLTNNEVEVSVVGNSYRVIDSKSSTHYVTKEKTCSCGVPDCTAIKLVAVYLKKGGKRAPDFPKACPICGAAIHRDPTWDCHYSHRPGWRCEKGGLAHFLEFNTRRIAKQFSEDPWIFHPVFLDGICVYPGIRREELLTWEECNRALTSEFLETGYDPRL
jgi:hypothetical protein